MKTLIIIYIYNILSCSSSNQVSMSLILVYFKSYLIKTSYSLTSNFNLIMITSSFTLSENVADLLSVCNRVQLDTSPDLLFLVLLLHSSKVHEVNFLLHFLDFLGITHSAPLCSTPLIKRLRAYGRIPCACSNCNGHVLLLMLLLLVKYRQRCSTACSLT